MKVLVCGSRDFTDRMAVWDILTGLYVSEAVGWGVVHYQPFTVIEGGQKAWDRNREEYIGADFLAAEWVHNCPLHGEVLKGDVDAEALWRMNGMPVRHQPFPADWEAFGRGAGPVRNQRMLEKGQPDLALAFVNKPLADSGGTADMVSRARAAGVKVIVVEVHV